MRTLLTGLAALTLSTVGCKERSEYYDRAPSSQKQVEEAQNESAHAYDRAKEAQETASEEAREAARAEENVFEKRQGLQEAESKAAASQQEAVSAQDLATREGEAAQAEAKQAQARASQAQRRAIDESHIGMEADPIENPAIANNLEIARLRAQIDAAISRVIHGTERGVQSLDQQLDRLAD
jgi:hypothetical protein